MVLFLSERKIFLFSFVAITVIFLLLGSPAIASFGISITIPDINYKYIIIWILLGLLVVLEFRQNPKLDIITLLLVVRSILLCTMTIVNRSVYPDSWKTNTVAIVFVPFVYCIAKFASITDKDIKNILLKISCLFTFILSIQIIILFIRSVLINHLPWNYVKSTIEVPLGRSNYLAAFLILFIIYIDVIMQPNIKKFLILFLGLVAIFCSMSDGAYILVILYYLPKIFIKVKDIFLLKNMSLKIVMAIIIMLLVIAAFFVLFYSLIEGAFQHFLRDTLYANGMQGLLNGRDKVYDNSINIIIHNWLLGIGLGTITGQTTRSHNLILQLLVSGGIINLFIFLFVYIKIFVMNFRERKKSVFAKAVMLMMLFSFINSMFEPTYQSVMYDFIMFTFMGFSMNKNIIKRVGTETCLKKV